jgi:methyl-accepting chemotaxis protein
MELIIGAIDEIGRGFAVVAQEVRALAQRSADTAKQIKILLSSANQQALSAPTLSIKRPPRWARLSTRFVKSRTLCPTSPAAATQVRPMEKLAVHGFEYSYF